MFRLRIDLISHSSLISQNQQPKRPDVSEIIIIIIFIIGGRSSSRQESNI